jgi:hypothetical protein
MYFDTELYLGMYVGMYIYRCFQSEKPKLTQHLWRQELLQL